MFFIGLILMIVLLDLGIKDMIEETKETEFPKELERTGGKIVLHKNHNAGFPFGAFAKRPEMVKGVPLVIMSGVAGIFLWLLPKKGHQAEKFALALVLGGGFSNLYDRFVRSYVVDYFSIRWKKLQHVVFNLGDIFIFLGAGILCVREIADTVRGK